MIRTILRLILAIFYGVAGWIHLTNPAPFLQIMPSMVPAPDAVVWLTGVAELAGSAALIQPWWPRLRRWGAIGLALYALCVWPANINHFALDMARETAGESGSLGLAYHVPRMFAQPLIIWLALWVGNVVDWPFGKRHPA